MTATVSDDPAGADLTALGAAIATRQVSVGEVVAATRARRDGIGASAFITRREDELAGEVAAAEQAVVRGDRLGPLHGIPFTVKDIIATASVRTTLGSAAFADLVPRHDATAVARLRAAGALLVGKTNCPEFAFGVTCESPVAGATASPYGERFSPGGSSGGEAVAVATGGSSFGLGSDFGGSLRWPAQCTGIMALRPTPGRIPGTGQLPGLGGGLGLDGPALVNPATLQGALQVVGPLARSVADLALLLGVLAGPDGLDPFCGPPAPMRLEVSVAALRVGVCDGATLGPVRAETKDACRSAAAALEPFVRDVVERPDALRGALEAYNDLRALEQLADHRLALAARGREPGDAVRAALDAIPPPDPLEEARRRRHALEVRARALRIFDDLDVLLLPVAPGPACSPAGELEVDDSIVSGWPLMAHCRAVSLLGCPAVSVPVARSSEGLPLSVQVVAQPFAEAEALAVAAVLETHNPLGATR
ncbi:MAG: amidase [Actinomycetota bacterium]|jgi:amidase|nr:amidase [Actinomycetota bacterium]